MRKLNPKIEEEIQLNLTPMMDLFVALIPFLILSSTFMSLGGIDLQAPSASSSKVEATHHTQNELWLMVEVKESKASIQGYGKDFGAVRDQVKAEFDISELEQMKAFFTKLENADYKMGPSLFHASPDTKYEQAITFLNVVRQTKAVSDIVMAAGVVE